MRVLVVNHSAAQHLGGSELSVLGIIAAWRDRRPALEPILLSPATGTAMERAAVAAGWTTEVAPYGGWVTFTDRESRARRRLERATSRDQVEAVSAIIQRVQPALVIVNTVVTPWAAVAAREQGIPVAWFLREFVDDRPGFRLREGREQTLRLVDALADVILANSSAVRTSVGDVIPEHRVEIAHPVIDQDAVQSAAALRGPTTDSIGPLRIGMVGRVTPQKGQRVAVEALAALHDRGIEAELIVIGGVILPGFDHELHRLARRRGVADRLTLIGERQRPLEALASSHVSLVPSTREAFGRVNLESLALGLPVIASHDGGAAELIEHDVCGFLVDANDPDDVANALARYARDRRLVITHGIAAQRRAAELIEGPHGAAATIDVLEGVVAAPRRSAAAGDSARASLLGEARPLTTAQRVSLVIVDRVTTAAHRLNRLMRDPRRPLRRRWVVLIGRARERARRG